MTRHPEFRLWPCHSLIDGSKIVAFRSAKEPLLSRSERLQYTATRLFSRDRTLGLRISTALLLTVIALAWPIAAAAQTGLDWRPDKTWVFAVGVLEYQHPDVWRNQPAAKAHRRDVQLVEHFRQSGIPAAQIVYLQDREATQQQIRQSLARLLQRTRQGDLLILYYTGHGSRDHQTREVHFVNYDAKDGSTAWSVVEIAKIVDQGFQGDKALLMADCCYSGALAEELRRHDRRVPFACLCSSFSHNSSTGNWTYTDAILKGLRGHPAVDLNGDGQVEFSEIAAYSELDMAFIEKQKSVSAISPHFPVSWKLATTAGRAKPRLGERLEVHWRDKWYRAQIFDVKENQFHITYVNFDSSWDEWVGSDRIRPYRPKEFSKGENVDVYWAHDQKWYPATIRRAWYGLHFVHYEGYAEEYDDWVPPDAVRPRR